MKHVVIAVHGTWGRSPTGFYHYAEDPTSFCQRLLRSLAPEIAAKDVIWEPFEWNHGNNHQDRIEGARELAKLLEQSRKAKHLIHVVTHSHGGNVALKAIEMYLGEIQLSIRRNLEGADLVEKSLQAIAEFGQLATAGPEGGGPLEEALGRLVLEIDQRTKGSIRAVMPGENTEQDQASAAEGQDLMRTDRRGFKKFFKIVYDQIRNASLRVALARVIQLASVRPEVHRIGSVVTMGTPFFFKHWQPAVFSKILTAVIGALLFAVYAAFGWYLGVLFWGGLLALLPFVDFVGWNPLYWPGWLQVLYLLVFVVPSTVLAIVDDRTKLRDTNIYFDAAAISSLLDSLGDARICRMLNIHSGLLDEPYLGMSVFPTLDPYIRKKIEAFTRPKPWLFVPVQRRVGVSAQSLLAQVIRTGWTLVKALVALLLLILYPARYLLHLLTGGFLKQAATKRLRVAAYGLPPIELAESRIAVNSNLVQDYFAHESYDASQHLTGLTIDTRKEINRFDFLWDDSLVGLQYRESILGQHIGDGLSLDEKRQILALEERGKEFFGVTGVRHSMYYDNDAVIDKIAEFIKSTTISSVAPAT